MNYLSYLFFYTIFYPSVLMLSITSYGSKQSKYINPSQYNPTTQSSTTSSSSTNKHKTTSLLVRKTLTTSSSSKITTNRYKLNHLMMVAQHFDSIERNKLNELNKHNHFIESTKLRPNNNIDIFQPVIVGK